MGSDALLFYAFAAVTVIGALMVVTQKNPVYSVLSIIAAFFGLAGLYVLLEAPFVAVVQIIIYAGAIMVLFLFVVMLLNVPKEDPPPASASALLGPTGMRIAVLLSAALGMELVWAMSRMGPAWFSEGPSATSVSSVTTIGVALFTRHAFAFEATSILILVAMVGAVVLARKEERS